MVNDRRLIVKRKLLTAARDEIFNDPIFIIDFRHFLIPDVLTFPGMLFGLVLSVLPGGQTPWQSLYGGVGAGAFLWLVGFTASKLL